MDLKHHANIMKYIDAEKLKTWLENEADMEFKKTEESADSPVLCHFHNGCRMQALDTIDFITSLQQEQPEGGCSEKPNNIPSNLDDAAEEWCKTNNKGIALSADKKSHYLAEGKDAFKAGAEWCELQLRKFFEEHNQGDATIRDCLAYKEGFRDGAEWMAEQGDTFETIMQEDDVDELVPTCPDMYNHGYSCGDKVIVQIRKKQ